MRIVPLIVKSVVVDAFAMMEKAPPPAPPAPAFATPPVPRFVGHSYDPHGVAPLGEPKPPPEPPCTSHTITHTPTVSALVLTTRLNS
jgi:hypothetical protein